MAKRQKINQEKMIFYFNNFISGYGQDFIKPLILLLLALLVYSAIAYGYKENYLYIWMPQFNPAKERISAILNYLAGNVPPYNNFLKEGMEFISLIYYLIVTVLIWHTITALKRISAR